MLAIDTVFSSHFNGLVQLFCFYWKTDKEAPSIENSIRLNTTLNSIEELLANYRDKEKRKIYNDLEKSNYLKEELNTYLNYIEKYQSPYANKMIEAKEYKRKIEYLLIVLSDIDRNSNEIVSNADTFYEVNENWKTLKSQIITFLGL